MKKIIIPYIYVCLLFAIGCEHKDLCIHHPHTSKIKVVFDWKNAPEATPSGMSIWFYPVDGGEAIYYDLSRNGGTVKVTDGAYNIICYNNDSEYLYLKGTSKFNTITGYTREGGIFECVDGKTGPTTYRAEGAEDEKVALTIDQIWGCNAYNVEVDMNDGVKYTCYPEEESNKALEIETKEHIITLYPTDLVCNYTYEIRHMKNAEHASQMCGTLSGMSRELTFSDNSLGTECFTLPSLSTINREDGSATGQFYTFGHHEDIDKPHKMVFYVWMSDGKVYVFRNHPYLDVTSQVHQEHLEVKNKRRVHIVIDQLELPEPINGDSGFQPTVDDWVNVIEDIVL